jgi:hypothetical protein
MATTLLAVPDDRHPVCKSERAMEARMLLGKRLGGTDHYDATAEAAGVDA